MTLEIRRAGAVDRAAVEALFAEIAREEGEDPAAAAEGLRRSVEHNDTLGSEAAWLYCASEGGAFVGYASVVRFPKLDERVGYLFVDELHVLRGHRRRGVASGLIGAVVDRARVLGYCGVRLLVRRQNDAACALYARLGFDFNETGICERRLEEG